MFPEAATSLGQSLSERLTTGRLSGTRTDPLPDRVIANWEIYRASEDTFELAWATVLRSADYEVKVVESTHSVDSIVQEANSNG